MGDHHRRCQADDIAAHPAEESVLLHRLVDAGSDLLVGREFFLGRPVLDDLDGDHQAQSTDLADVGMIAEGGVESLEQVTALLGRLPGEVLALDDVEVGHGNGTTDRVGAVGVGVHPDVLAVVQHGGDLVVDAGAAQREVPRGDGLGVLDHVGLDSPVFQPEHPAGSPEPGDDLVGGQQHVVLVTDLADAWEIIVGRHQHAPGSLHRFGHEHRDRFGTLFEDFLFEFVGRGDSRTDALGGLVAVRVGRGDVREARDTGFEHRPVTADSRGTHRRQRHTVVGPLPRDDLGLLGLAQLAEVIASGLEVRIAGFATAGCEEKPVDRRVGHPGQSFGQGNRIRVGTAGVARAVGQGGHLVAGRVGQFLATVTGDDVPEAGETIDVFPAVGVDQCRTGSTDPDMSVLVAGLVVQRVDQVCAVTGQQGIRGCRHSAVSMVRSDGDEVFSESTCHFKGGDGCATMGVSRQPL